MVRIIDRIVLVLVSLTAFCASSNAQAVSSTGSAGATGFVPAPPRTWVVDASGGGQFEDLPPAVAVAHDGDLILVRDGTYSALVLDDLGVTVLADGKAVLIEGASSVTSLPEGETAVLKGLTLVDPSTGGVGAPVLTIADAAGSVWIEDTRVGTTTDGIEARDATGVVIVRSEVFSDGFAPCATAAEALAVLRASVHVFDSAFSGSDAACGTLPFAGATGARVEEGFLYAAASSFEGGRGTPSVCPPLSSVCSVRAGRGGDGLVVDEASLAVLLDSALAAGAEGSPSAGCALCGASGVGMDVVGDVTLVAGPARSHVVQSPIHSGKGGSSYVVRAEGLAGDMAFSLYAKRSRPVYDPGLLGPLLTNDPPLVVWPEGVISAEGVLERTYFVPPVLLGHERLFVQGLFVDAGAEEHLAGGSAIYVLP